MSNEETTTGSSGPARRNVRQGSGGSPVGSTVSIVLAVVAVIAGFLILRNITDDGDGGSSSDLDPTDVGVTTTSTTDPAAASTTSTTAVPALVTEGATVIVANASGVPGSAARMSDTLAGAGFTMGEPTNVSDGNRVDETIVYYDGSVASAQAVADSVAVVMGGLVVEPVPTPPPTEDGTLAGGGVLVLLGKNQADKTLADLSGGEETVETGSSPPVSGSEDSTPADTTPTDTTG